MPVLLGKSLKFYEFIVGKNLEGIQKYVLYIYVNHYNICISIILQITYVDSKKGW